MRNLFEMQPTPFSDYPWKHDAAPAYEDDGSLEAAEADVPACALCEADDGYVCPVHGSLILELL